MNLFQAWLLGMPSVLESKIKIRTEELLFEYIAACGGASVCWINYDANRAGVDDDIDYCYFENIVSVQIKARNRKRKVIDAVSRDLMRKLLLKCKQKQMTTSMEGIANLDVHIDADQVVLSAYVNYGDAPLCFDAVVELTLHYLLDSSIRETHMEEIHDAYRSVGSVFLPFERPVILHG